jgi:hypothetical protein
LTDCEPLATALFAVFGIRNDVQDAAPHSFNPVDKVEIAPGSEKWLQLEYLGWHPTPVHAPLAKLLQKSSACPTMEELWSRAEQVIRQLPEWQPQTEEQRNLAAKYRPLAADWFRGHLSAEQIIFKLFPPGNVDQVVFALHAHGQTAGSATPSTRHLSEFCVDINLLDSGAVHKWRRTKLDEGCADERVGPDHIKRCGGSCILERFQSALQQEIGRKLSYTAKMKLEQQVKSAMLRRETKHLSGVDLPPTPPAAAPAACTASNGKSASTSAVGGDASPDNNLNEADLPGVKTAVPTAVGSVGSKPHDKDGRRATNNLGSSTCSDDPNTRPVTVGTVNAAETTAAAAFLRHRCLEASPSPGKLDDCLASSAKPERTESITEAATSEMCLDRAQPICLNIQGQKHLIELYVERGAQPLSLGLQRATEQLAQLCACRLALQLFGFSLADVAAKVHIFVEKAARIAFNLGRRNFSTLITTQR